MPYTQTTLSDARRARLRMGFLFYLLTFLFGVTSAESPQMMLPNEQTATLVVCAEAQNLPFSAQDESGFENQLARILADDLNLNLEYVWMDSLVTQRRSRLLQDGTCDLVMAVAEGQEGYSTSAAYYVSRYSFVYKSDAPFVVESFDDEILSELTIGVQMPTAGGGGPGLQALAKRSLVNNIRSFFADPSSLTPHRAIMDSVASGGIDVAIVWGPVAGYFASHGNVGLTVVPVEPVIDFPFQPMSFAIALGARQGDTALVDDLNLALSHTWTEIQDLLDNFGVPTEPLPTPSQGVIGRPDWPEVVRIGVIAPAVNSRSVADASYYVDSQGLSLTRGAQLAEGELAGRVLTEPLLFLATAQGAEDSARAATRLITVDKVDVLIGGVTAASSQAISGVASNAGILYFDVGTSPDAIPAYLDADNVITLQPTEVDYLDALISWFGDASEKKWFVVYPDAVDGRRLATKATQLLSAGGGADSLAGSVAVPTDALTYFSELETIRSSPADVVLLLLPPEQQIAFLSQQAIRGPSLPIASYPYFDMQSRERISNIVARGQSPDLQYFLQVWDPTLHGINDTQGSGSDLNQRFSSRWGTPMEAPAWAAYVAVIAASRLAANQATRGAFDGSLALRMAAEVESEVFPPKPSLVGESQVTEPMLTNHHLIQSLYMLRVTQGHEWGPELSSQLSAAEPVGIWLPWERTWSNTEGAPPD